MSHHVVNLLGVQTDPAACVVNQGYVAKLIITDSGPSDTSFCMTFAILCGLVGSWGQILEWVNNMKDLDLVILSLIAEAPRYAHEIHQVIDHRDLRNWVSIGGASLYYMLDRLETQGFVRGELPYETMRSARKRYDITPNGRAILHTALADRLSQSPAGVGWFDIGLLLAHALPPGQVHELLKQRLSDLHYRLDATRTAQATLADEHGPNLDVRRSLYQRMQALIECDIDWLQTFLTTWQQHHNRATPPPADKLDALLAPNRLQKMRRPKPPQDE